MKASISSAFSPVFSPVVLFLFFFFFHSSHRSVAAVSIPKMYDGFLYGGELKKGSSIVVEAFLDPVCPDSRDTWDPLLDVIEHYSPQVSLIVHPFPLPYHDNSFLSCRALHVANELNESATFPLLEHFFKYQTRYYNDRTSCIPKADVIKLMVDFAAEVIGSSSKAAFEDGFKDNSTDMAARTSFKYGCSRGVIGTPFFLVNGFALPGAGSAIDFDEWKSIIGPLLPDLDE